ncbi:hypothetical protein BG55_01830 [Erwinia mallotivora]|uniref:Uncharacterized protein n=1 Tax=Erwinia mallotivora TaxID=69222 RepID=A0A014MGG7_9GAMM|nr:hypothetical protein BG55_01830 [Erwinia mallotivora]
MKDNFNNFPYQQVKFSLVSITLPALFFLLLQPVLHRVNLRPLSSDARLRQRAHFRVFALFQPGFRHLNRPPMIGDHSSGKGQYPPLLPA